MGWSNHHLTYPYLLADLRTALGCTGENLLDGIFANGNVKLCARYKGFRNNTEYFDRYGDSNSQRKAGLIAANYGISIPTFSYLGSPGASGGLLYALLNGAAMWSYNRPSKQNSRLRFLDFEGYYDEAKDLMVQLSVVTYTLDSQNNLTITWPSPAIVEGEDGQLLTTDIKIGGVALSSCYFGALVYYSDSQYTYVAANQNSRTITLSNMGAYSGKNVRVVPFFSTEQISQGGTPSGNVTLASFNLSPIQIAINASVPAWTISSGGNAWDEFGFGVDYAINVFNNGGSSGTITVRVWLTDDPTSASTHLKDGSGTVTVAAGGSASVTGFLRYTKQSGPSYRIAAYGEVGGQAVTDTGIYSIMSPTPQ